MSVKRILNQILYFQNFQINIAIFVSDEDCEISFAIWQRGNRNDELVYPLYFMR